MPWFTLLVLVPAVLVPVVLLFGFSGCAQLAGIGEASTDDPVVAPAAPSDLIVMAASETKIQIQWVNNATDAHDFFVHRVPGPAPFVVSNSFTTPDEPLPEGSTFSYTVVAQRAGTSDLSVPSPEKMATTFPSAPSGFSVVAKDEGTLTVQWTNHSMKADRFGIVDVRVSDGLTTPSSGMLSGANPQSTDLTVTAGTAHKISLFVTVQGFQNASPGAAAVFVPSASTAVVTAKPLAFKAALAAETSGLEGATIVQRIPTSLLQYKGLQQLKVTLHGPAVGTLKIDQVTFSAAGGVNPYDPAGLPTIVANGVSLAANATVTLPPFSFILDGVSVLLLAFDINPTQTPVGIPKGAKAGSDAFSLVVDPPESRSVPRTDGYTPEPGTVYLIAKIEVV